MSDATMHPAVTNGSYDVSRIREDFPILAMQVYGKPLIYLDNAASAQKPRAVLDRLDHAYTAEYANVHRGCIISPMRRPRPMRGAREKVAAFLNAPRKEEIVFTRNAPRPSIWSAYTFGQQRIKAGDEIVLSIMEHHSNIVPWHFLRERHGAVIKWAPVDDEGNFPHRRVREAAHAAHPDGRHHPDVEHAGHGGAGEARVVALAHARGIPVLVDGSQAAVASRRRRHRHRLRLLRLHRPQALTGPTGIGVLYGKHRHLADMPPLQRRLAR